MKNIFNIKKIIKFFFKKLGFRIMSENAYQNLKLNIVNLNLSKKKYKKFLDINKESKSDLNQESFALLETNFKTRGFFVEIGATNGVYASNTYLLEKRFKWKGVLAEPAKIWHADLYKNRSCYIEKSCVWSSSGKVINFSESKVPSFSTVKKFAGNDIHRNERKDSKNYNVKTISLADLLKKYNAPKIIDYLSIDTEGSEFEILKKFNFNSYKFNFICCEHNYNSIVRKKINNLLRKNGYKIKYSQYSSYDDWYVRN